MHKKKQTEMRKTNMKLYPFYKMVGYDLMFLYAIQILFLMQVKNFSASQSILLGSFYAIFIVAFSIPLNIVVAKLGKRKAMMLGNIFNLIYILMLIFCHKYYMFVIAEFMEAIGFALKGITESAFLNESIPTAEKKADIFTRIDGNGYSRYSYFNAVAMMLSGLLYDINPYIPLVCAAICVTWAIILCANFAELEEEKELKKKRKNNDQHYKQLKASLKFILKSSRLRALLLMSAIIIGMIRFIVYFNPTLLESVGCSATLIGTLSAIFELTKGVTSNRANEFNKRFRNKSYTVIILTITTCLTISGVILLFNIDRDIQLAVVVVAYMLIYMVKGYYQVLRSRYLNNFSNSKILHNLYSVDVILENIARTIITTIASAVIGFSDVRYATITIGVVFTVVAILVSIYMKSRVGLKPEEYKKEDIEFKG